MSTTIGIVKDRDDEKIELEVYISGGITLMVYDHNNLEPPCGFKVRLNEEGFDELLEKLIIAGKQLGYKSNWMS